jgi:hypothetical protein
MLLLIGPIRALLLPHPAGEPPSLFWGLLALVATMVATVALSVVAAIRGSALARHYLRSQLHRKTRRLLRWAAVLAGAGILYALLLLIGEVYDDPMRPPPSASRSSAFSWPWPHSSAASPPSSPCYSRSCAGTNPNDPVADTTGTRKARPTRTDRVPAWRRFGDLAHSPTRAPEQP